MAPSRLSSLASETDKFHVMKDKFFAEQTLLTPPIARAAYSDRTAWLMAEFSRLAYMPFEKHETTLGLTLLEADFQLVQTFDNNGTQAFLAKRDSFAVLSFRGTEPDGRDVLTDLKAGLRRTRKGLLHTGFYQAFKGVAQEIREAVLDLGETPLYITGHSLGGALATIAAQELERDSLAAVYTFGSPRVGTVELDTRIKVPIYRVVNSADVVARVPLMAMKYQHVGSLHYLTAKGQMKRSPSSIGTFFSMAMNAASIFADHSILEYTEKLAKIAKSRNSFEVSGEQPAVHKQPDLKIVRNSRVS